MSDLVIAALVVVLVTGIIVLLALCKVAGESDRALEREARKRNKQ